MIDPSATMLTDDFAPVEALSAIEVHNRQMAEATAPPAIRLLLYANAFIVGGVLMGFEMLGGRYLYPYFGSGIGTWAA